MILIINDPPLNLKSGCRGGLRFKRSLQTAIGVLIDALEAMLMAAFQSAFRENPHWTH